MFSVFILPSPVICTWFVTGTLYIVLKDNYSIEDDYTHNWKLTFKIENMFYQSRYTVVENDVMKTEWV